MNMSTVLLRCCLNELNFRLTLSSSPHGVFYYSIRVKPLTLYCAKGALSVKSVSKNILDLPKHIFWDINIYDLDQQKIISHYANEIKDIAKINKEKYENYNYSIIFLCIFFSEFWACVILYIHL